MPFVPTLVIAAAGRQQRQSIADCIAGHLACELFEIGSMEEVYPALAKSVPDILVIDLSWGNTATSLALLAKIRKNYPTVLILPLIAATDRGLVRQVLALDVFFYILTPLEATEARETIRRAWDHLRLQHTRSARPASRPIEEFHGIIGSSPAMRKLFDLIVRIADDDQSTVLIRGESGTGKEMVAKAIHAQSCRAHKNFVPVNCAAIPDDLLESELFGYTKGAFTGANTNKQGRIQYADGGTLFLDEIGDMKSSLQAKLLRVLQEKEFEPVGALKPTPVDTRVLAATHCDLEQLVREGKFREDLYYRLSVIPVHIPSLKERREDIPLLTAAFIASYTSQRNREPFVFSAEAQLALEHYEWRGNVRELENLIQHMSILYAGKKVEFTDLPEKFQAMREIIAALPVSRPAQPADAADRPAPPFCEVAPPLIAWEEGCIDFNVLINDFETRLIIHAMKIAAGNKKEAARILCLKRTTLLEKIKKKDLHLLWDD